MVLGFSHRGKIYNLHKQSIQTRMFHICWIPLLPAIPLNSFLVFDKATNCIVIPLNLLSLLIGYTRGLSFFVSLVSLIIYSTDNDINDLYRSIICISIFIFSYIILIPSRKQLFQRRLIGLETGIFSQPQWLKKETQIELLSALESKWNESNKFLWQSAIKSHDCQKEKIPLLFSIAAFKKNIERNDQNSYLFNEVVKMAKENYSFNQIKSMVKESLK